MARNASTTRTTGGDPRDHEIIDGEFVDTTEKALARVGSAGMVDISMAIAMQESELNQKVAYAQSHRRDMKAAMDDALYLATLDPETASECRFAMPRGRDADGKAKAIMGPSVRLAELLAQQWGNNTVAARPVAVDLKEKWVEAEGIYHDLQTNATTVSRVRRRISGKSGALYNEDMRLVTMNAAAAIAKRNAIFGGIPRPIWRRVYAAVEAVLDGDSKTIVERRLAMLKAFQDNLGVAADRVFAILGVRSEEEIKPGELAVAQGFYAALRNNEVTIDDLIGQTLPAGDRKLSSAYDGVAADEKVDPKTGEVTARAEGEPARTAEPDKASPASATAASQASPAKEASGQTQRAEPSDDGKPDDVQGGIPGPEEVYFHSADSWGADGRRPTYQDGVRFSSANRAQLEAGRILIFAQHSPVKAPEGEQGQGEQTGASPTTPASTTTSPAESESATASTEGFAFSAPYQAFRNALAAAESWLQINPAWKTLRKTEAFTAATPAEKFAAKQEAARAGLRVAEKGDPVRPGNEPEFFLMWLSIAPKHEIMAAWQDLILSPKYSKLEDEQKDAMAEAYEGALEPK